MRVGRAIFNTLILARYYISLILVFTNLILSLHVYSVKRAVRIVNVGEKRLSFSKKNESEIFAICMMKTIYLNQKYNESIYL